MTLVPVLLHGVKIRLAQVGVILGGHTCSRGWGEGIESGTAEKRKKASGRV